MAAFRNKHRRSHNWPTLSLILAAAKSYDSLDGTKPKQKLAELKSHYAELIRAFKIFKEEFVPACRLHGEIRNLESKHHSLWTAQNVPRNWREKVFGRTPSTEEEEKIANVVAKIKLANERTHNISTTSLTRDEQAAISRYHGSCEYLIGKIEPYLHLLEEAIAEKEEEESLRLTRIVAQATKEQEREANVKRRRLEDKALLAAYKGNTRRLARSVRKNLVVQLSILSFCPYCEGELGDMPHADHIYPVSHGGLSTSHNMVFVCEQCNIAKGNLTLREFAKVRGLDLTRIEMHLEQLGKKF